MLLDQRVHVVKTQQAPYQDSDDVQRGEVPEVASCCLPVLLIASLGQTCKEVNFLSFMVLM